MFDRYWDQMVARVGTGLMPTESDSANWKFEELGCGHYGCVLATESPGTVIKLTTDMSEAAFVSGQGTDPGQTAGERAELVRTLRVHERPRSDAEPAQPVARDEVPQAERVVALQYENLLSVVHDPPV